MTSAVAAMANKNNNDGDDSSMMGDSEEQMELLDILNQEGLYSLEKASQGIDLMISPFHSSTASRCTTIEKQLEKAFDMFRFVATQRMRVTGRGTLAQDYYSLACVHSLSAELSMVLGSRGVSSSLTADMLGHQEYIDAQLEEAEELLMLAEAAGYTDPERSIQKDRKLRVVRAASRIHSATRFPPTQDMVSNYKLI
jgi:transcriptional antiterminator Rof (Rho-off)